MEQSVEKYVQNITTHIESMKKLSDEAQTVNQQIQNHLTEIENILTRFSENNQSVINNYWEQYRACGDAITKLIQLQTDGRELNSEVTTDTAIINTLETTYDVNQIPGYQDFFNQCSTLQAINIPRDTYEAMQQQFLEKQASILKAIPKPRSNKTITPPTEEQIPKHVKKPPTSVQKHSPTPQSHIETAILAQPVTQYTATILLLSSVALSVALIAGFISGPLAISAAVLTGLASYSLFDPQNRLSVTDTIHSAWKSTASI